MEVQFDDEVAIRTHWLPMGFTHVWDPEKIKLKIVGFGGDELILHQEFQSSSLGYDNYLYGFNVKNHRWTGYQIIDGKFVAYEIQETEIATQNRERSVTSVELKFEHIAATGVLRVLLDGTPYHLDDWKRAVSDLAQFSFGQGSTEFGKPTELVISEGNQRWFVGTRRYKQELPAAFYSDEPPYLSLTIILAKKTIEDEQGWFCDKFRSDRAWKLTISNRSMALLTGTARVRCDDSEESERARFMWIRDVQP